MDEFKVTWVERVLDSLIFCVATLFQRSQVCCKICSHPDCGTSPGAIKLVPIITVQVVTRAIQIIIELKKWPYVAHHNAELGSANSESKYVAMRWVATHRVEDCGECKTENSPREEGRKNQLLPEVEHFILCLVLSLSS